MGTTIDPVDFYKCLADDTRLRCLLLIAHEQELCVCELTEGLQDIQPKVSRHLAQLRKASILLDRRQGQWVFYRVNPALPEWALAVIEQTTKANRRFLAANLKNLQRMKGRPDRACCA